MRNLLHPSRGGVLFTAFEPSGDEHAAWVIAELKRRHPNLPVYAWGGARMERAGATIVERTGEDAVMGVPGLRKIIQHQRLNQRVEAWLDRHPVLAHIPVDSPAANGPICEIAKSRGLKVIHLVAPQIWAWGRWRIHRLRRQTDLVLCLLPFEAPFFERRRVPARFIGHFLFDEPPDTAALAVRAANLPEGEPRIAMMPGSRPDELRRHVPVLIESFMALKGMLPNAVGVVAATSEAVAAYVRRTAESRGGWPTGLSIVVQETDAVIYWCQVALVKSGTITLQVARQRKPMVVFYRKSNPLFFTLARAVLSTRVFSLPNVLAHDRIVPEFIPHYGGTGPIVREAHRLLVDPHAAEQQCRAVDNVLAPFRGRRAAAGAVDAIEEVLGLVAQVPASAA